MSRGASKRAVFVVFFRSWPIFAFDTSAKTEISHDQPQWLFIAALTASRPAGLRFDTIGFFDVTRRRLIAESGFLLIGHWKKEAW